MIKTLRRQFVCFTMVLVFAMLFIIFCMVYVFTARNLENSSLQTLHTVSGRPDQNENDEPRIQVPYVILQQDSQGNWFAQGNDYYDLTDEAFLSSLLEAVSGETEREGVLEAQQMRYLRSDRPFLRYVFLDISAERTTLKQLIGTLASIGFLSLLLLFGISVLLSRWATHSLETAWEQQKQFIADASHELKTPLAVILSNAELLMEGNYPEEEQKNFKQNILTMSHHMRHLVENLLELARLDNVTPNFVPLDFSRLTETALLPFEPVLFEADLVLETDLLPDLWVKGSAPHLQQVIEVFLDNARKYAAPGTVTVKLDKAGAHALLQVQTQGPPLSAEDAQRIFHRFYRVDAARKRDGSYGLGLSIAQKITQQHGGKIWAEGDSQGNRFCVLLPLCHKEEKQPELPQ